MPELSFDITSAASSYSAVAGILAGFSFAVFFGIFERLENARDTEATARSITFLAVNLVGNILAALLWSIVAGTKHDEIALVLMIFATLCFTLVTPLTIQSLIFVVLGSSNRKLWNASKGALKIVYAFSIFIVGAYLTLTIVDVMALQEGIKMVEMYNQYPENFAPPAIIVISFVILVIWLLLGNERDENFLTKRFGIKAFTFLFFTTIIIFALGFALYHGDIGLTHNDYLHPLAIFALTLLWSLTLLSSILLFQTSQEEPTHYSPLPDGISIPS